jgi:hypothetical protein
MLIQKMSNDVWYGALISVPVGIATGLAVPPLQRWLENRGNQKLAEQERRSREEYEEVLFYRKNPETFTQYLVHVAIQTAFIGAVVAVLSALWSAVTPAIASALPHPNSDFVLILYSLPREMVAIISSLLIIRICRPAMALWSKVKNFDRYEQAIPQEQRDHWLLSARSREAYKRHTGEKPPDE